MLLLKTVRSLRLTPGSTLLLALLLVFLAASPLLAQVESGKVLGEVQDSTGAMVKGAKVTVSNVDTGVTHEVNTGAGGEYVVTELRPGSYTVSIEQAGFKKAVQPAFKLDVNQVVRFDVTLVPGMVTEHVEVSAVEPLVESQTSSIGQVIEETQVHQLPCLSQPRRQSGRGRRCAARWNPRERTRKRLYPRERPDGNEQQFFAERL